jgi:hypothetical protein
MPDYQKINLRNHGYTTSGRNSGDPASLLAELNSVLQGKILDSTIDDILTEEEKNKTLNEISSLKNEISVLRQRIDDSILKNQKREEQKAKLQSEIDSIRLGEPINNRPQEDFSWMKLGTNLFFFIPLSIYLFLFYVATIYKVFYFDATSIAESSNGTISALPASGEMTEALTFNYLLLFAPFLFFGFGYAVHVLLELKSKIKYLYIALVLSVTFILDFLMAYKIHKSTSEAEQMLFDSKSVPLFEDSNFYIILFMGFVVYIIWSILLNSFLNEWKKRNVIGRRVEMIHILDTEIETENNNSSSCNAEIKIKEGEIELLNDVIQGVKIPLDKLKFCLSELYAGWLSFVNGLDSLPEVQKSCQETYDRFLVNNNLNN